MNRTIITNFLIKSTPIGLMLCLVTALTAGCFPDKDLRLEHLQTLARWENLRLAPHDSLTAMLVNDDAHVRLAAARSAGLIGRTDIIPVLLELVDDPSVTVRSQAIFSLGFLGDSRSLPIVEESLRARHPQVRNAALMALAHLDNNGQALMKIASSGTKDEAILAWNALRNMVAKVDSVALVSSIKAGLLRPEASVRWQVLRCAEVIPSPSLLPVIAPFAHSKHPAVRVHAYRALQKQNSQAAVSAVMKGWNNQAMFHGRDLFRVQVAGLRALGTSGAKLLETGTKETDSQDALAAILINCSGSESPHVAETALVAMGNLIEDFPLPAAAAERESLLPVWRIRLARAAFSQVKNSHTGVREAAIGAWPLLRGAGSSAELTSFLGQEESSHVLAAGISALGQVHPDPVLILHQYSKGKSDDIFDGTKSWARHSSLARTAALTALAFVQTKRPEILLNGIPAGFIPSIIHSAATDNDFVISTTACDLLAEFPSEKTQTALVNAYVSSHGEGAAEVKRAALASLATILKIVPADSTALAVISSALDDKDIRVRLAGRQTAMVSNHFPDNLLPSVASLKATIPAAQHSSKQPEVHLPFSAPKVLCITSKGQFTIELNPEIAPNTCTVFLDLINKGFYEDLTFHRVVPDFVAQGGCPRGDGWGGPGFNIRSEWSDQNYERAVVGIAHDGKDTGGSQFFITLSPQPHLNGRYTIFGSVEKGMEIVDRLEKGDRFSLKTIQ